ncbi:LANO_0H25070g1_1 [Lachancea nothofagi CBS 11611]|uniref:LANO_0H25070g1_1 n=1 Tax=Lachancea nothofagi CBS 11611 TaxID=1266666 RepID=A0A1G4KP05_9SACH|nr:LANO_0H25070g1_1 [Lachancea nothofagi CBS 11611]
MSKGRFETLDEKYDAVKHRDPRAEGLFVYAVRTTGIVCRPTCSAKIAMQKNVEFFTTTREALEAGFRPCKKCKPHIEQKWNKHRELVLGLITVIHAMVSEGKSAREFKLADVSKKLDVSKWQLIKVFKRYTGTTPVKYYEDHLSGKHIICDSMIPTIETKRSWLRSQTAGKSSEKASDWETYANPSNTLDQDWLAEFL